MEIINIVKQDAGNIQNIDSFAIWDENKRNDVVKSTEELFLEKAKELGWDGEEHYCETEGELLDEGYYENNNGDSVSLVWSNVELN